jgi:AraC-like DNA-binding protein
MYSVKGITTLYEGQKQVKLYPGLSCVGSKNHPIRFIKESDNNSIETIFIKLDSPFLKEFKDKYCFEHIVNPGKEAIIPIDISSLLNKFITSLEPYYNKKGELNSRFLNVKREELLLILLDIDPHLGNLLFNFELPSKAELKRFMAQNFRLNISLDRFAYLSGRSLSSFKRDFQIEFNIPPRQWLTNRRLEEAYFLIETQHQKPANFYLDIGFENLSHFSYAFRERFGISPKQLLKSDKQS